MPKQDRIKRTGVVHKPTIPIDEELYKEAMKAGKKTNSRRKRVGAWRLDVGVNKGGRRLFG